MKTNLILTLHVLISITKFLFKCFNQFWNINHFYKYRINNINNLYNVYSRFVHCRIFTLNKKTIILNCFNWRLSNCNNKVDNWFCNNKFNNFKYENCQKNNVKTTKFNIWKSINIEWILTYSFVIRKRLTFSIFITYYQKISKNVYNLTNFVLLIFARISYFNSKK